MLTVTTTAKTITIISVATLTAELGWYVMRTPWRGVAVPDDLILEASTAPRPGDSWAFRYPKTTAGYVTFVGYLTGTQILTASGATSIVSRFAAVRAPPSNSYC